MKKKGHNNGFRLSLISYRSDDGNVHLKLNRQLRPYQWHLLPYGDEREKARIAYMGRHA